MTITKVIWTVRIQVFVTPAEAKQMTLLRCPGHLIDQISHREDHIKPHVRWPSGKKNGGLAVMTRVPDSVWPQTFELQKIENWKNGVQFLLTSDKACVDKSSNLYEY